GRRQPDDDAADQAGSGRGGDGVEVGESDLRITQGSSDDAVERLDMGAGSDLRHHAAEGGMIGNLREDDVGEDPAAAVRPPLDHRGRGLVAARLDAEDDHGDSALYEHSAVLYDAG